MQNILDSTLLNQKCFLFLWFGSHIVWRERFAATPPALDGDLRQELDDYLDRRENEVETMTTKSENYEEESYARREKSRGQERIIKARERNQFSVKGF
jgi:hypothetical protein